MNRSQDIAEGGMKPLLSLRGLTKQYPLMDGAVVRAVDGIDLDIVEGETVGIVGESGCGKSTTARLIMQLVPQSEGQLKYDGKIVDGSRVGLRDYYRRVQMVFQDSYASLNPRLPIDASVAFGLIARGQSRAEAMKKSWAMLSRVGLEPGRYASSYPHELSGGQRQRVNIARALALEPRVVLLDEAVSALDKSIEAQIINLLLDLRKEMGLTYVFISHDLNVVRFISDRVVVMYLGQVVEIGDVDSVYSDPRHPYTRALLAAMPSMNVRERRQTIPLAGEPPNAINPPSGCRFHPRCAFAEPLCSKVAPQLAMQEGRSQSAACHMATPGSGHSQAAGAS